MRINVARAFALKQVVHFHRPLVPVCCHAKSSAAESDTDTSRSSRDEGAKGFKTAEPDNLNTGRGIICERWHTDDQLPISQPTQ
jgi:hypothetical protein